MHFQIPQKKNQYIKEKKTTSTKKNKKKTNFQKKIHYIIKKNHYNIQKKKKKQTTISEKKWKKNEKEYTTEYTDKTNTHSLCLKANMFQYSKLVNIQRTWNFFYKYPRKKKCWLFVQHNQNSTET